MERKNIKMPEYSNENLLFGLLFMLNNRLQVIGDAFYDEITTKQWFAFIMIEMHGEQHPTLNDLAQVMGSSHQNVKQIVAKLQEKGFVLMYPDKKDKRKTRVMLLEKADELKKKYDSKQIEFMKKLYANVKPEDLKISVNVLATMQQNMDEM